MKSESNGDNTGTLLTLEQAAHLKVGERVRIVDPAGRVAQGAMEKRFYHYDRTGAYAVQVAGFVWPIGKVEVRLINQDDVEEIVPARVDLTAEALLKIIADRATVSDATSKLNAVGMDAIVADALGFDPVHYLPGPDFGGKSKSVWTNQHFQMSSAKKLLSAMVEAGELRAVASGSRFDRSDDEAYVSFGMGRSGWVLEDAYQASRARAESRQGDRRLSELRETARGIVADRHADEVELELALLVAAGR